MMKQVRSGNITQCVVKAVANMGLFGSRASVATTHHTLVTGAAADEPQLAGIPISKEAYKKLEQDVGEGYEYQQTHNAY